MIWAEIGLPRIRSVVKRCLILLCMTKLTPTICSLLRSTRLNSWSFNRAKTWRLSNSRSLAAIYNRFWITASTRLQVALFVLSKTLQSRLQKKRHLSCLESRCKSSKVAASATYFILSCSLERPMMKKPESGSAASRSSLGASSTSSQLRLNALRLSQSRILMKSSS